MRLLIILYTVCIEFRACYNSLLFFYMKMSNSEMPQKQKEFPTLGNLPEHMLYENLFANLCMKAPFVKLKS